jgi:hydroxymethylbilane synthase
MARAMADSVRDIILAKAPTINLSILTFVADGDKIEGSLQSHGGKGTFIKDLEQRLLADEVDCAVHSLKDIPGDLPSHPDLALITFLTREDPRDALVLHPSITEDKLMHDGGIIGSSAPRREAALRMLYPSAEVRMCRGNVNSRLRKLDEAQYDAIVLSYAGLKRLGLHDRVSRVFSADEVLPAVGQGIVTLQVRKADVDKCPYLRQINDTQAETAAMVERTMLYRLQGNCHSAIAGYCSFPTADDVNMCGIVYNSITGAYLKVARETKFSPSIANLGALVADDLIIQGANRLLQVA